MPRLATVYCTDEAILTWATGAWHELCPRDQQDACAADGVISGWVLSSASVDFAAQQVAAGGVVQLLEYGANKKSIGQNLVVEAVAGHACTLRRKGKAAGVGQPPPQASEVSFLAATLAPQVEKASYEINRRFGIDDALAGGAAADLYDPRELEQVTAYTVLERQYKAQARRAGDKDAADALWAAGRDMERQLADLLSRLELKWRPTIAGELGRRGSPAAMRYTR